MKVQFGVLSKALLNGELPRKTMTKLVITNAFGEPMKKEGQIGKTRLYGYESDSGSWALNPSGEIQRPCCWIAIRFKRKRKWAWVMRSRIVEGV